MVKAGSMKNEHLLSTNLHHFDALVSFIFSSINIVSLLETKSFKDDSGFVKKLTIDIICENGEKWVKVIARNPKALSQILTGLFNLNCKIQIVVLFFLFHLYYV